MGDIVEWFPLSGPLPDMAFEANAHSIERFGKTKLDGATADPDFALDTRVK